MAVQADIADAEAQRVREAVEKAWPSKKDLRHLGKGNFAGVMTGKGILDEMQERDKKDRERAAKKAERRQKSNSHKEASAQAQACYACSSSNSPGP